MTQTNYTTEQANIAVTQADNAVNQANEAVMQANIACQTAADCSEICVKARITADRAIKIAKDKDYNHLINVPDKLSMFDNDVGYITALDSTATDEEVGEMLNEAFS